ncbi:MAG TPA: hypothetical protein VE650_02475 [Acetobacteraceae bacterium]|nr:hypothetical protein [Acetobacteraceae bacterium]
MRGLVTLLALAIAAGPASAAEPVLVRVTLSSGGVGQFDYATEADGRATVHLDVPLNQVDDLLKSLRVDDPAGTPSVRLPGREPLAESFRTLPFGPEALGSPEALLRTLVGESVRVPGPGIAGVILAVNDIETVLPNQGGTQTRHRLTIATSTGLESVVLEDVPGVEFASAGLREQIAAALSAIAARRVQDRRTLQLTLAEGGHRSVRFGYVVPVPVWKASYRITMPGEGTDGPTRLQGYAVVENLSGRDWNAVEVVLTSGEPVLYHQPLYEAVYASRPEAPVEVGNRLAPPVDQGAVPGAIAGRFRAAPASLAPPPAPAPMMSTAQAAEAEPAQAEPPPSVARQSVAQVEFRLSAPVTASSGESLLLPIINRDIPARRVALYQPATDPIHPLVALLLRNDTEGALPPGLATLFERQADGPPGFIGDARLPAIQPGEERLASFAADLPVRIESAQSGDMLVTSGKAASGVLTLTRRERAVTTYRIATPAGSGRTVLIEVPKRPGWTLAEPRDASSTPTAYRVMRDVPADTRASLDVVLERPRSERVVLAELEASQLIVLSQDGALAPQLRAAMSRAATLRVELERRTTALREARERREQIVADQGRIRSNLAAVPANSELQRRYLAQLQQQETDLAALAGQIDAAQRAAAEADAALKTYLQALAL